VFCLGKSKAIVGLDICSSAVKAVELKAAGKGFKVVAFAIQPVPPDSIVDGAIIDGAAVDDRAVDDAVGRHRFNRKGGDAETLPRGFQLDGLHGARSDVEAHDGFAFFSETKHDAVLLG